MSDLDELLDSTKPRFVDVPIYLDAGLAEQRDALIREARALPDEDEADLRAGKKPRIVEIQEELERITEEMADRVLTIRITQMPGSKWSALKTRHQLKPKREENSDRDINNGFNTEAVARLALVDYGERLLPEGESEKLSTSQWTKLFDTISGGDIDALITQTLGVNQLNGQLQAATLLKASRRIEGSETK